MNSHPEIQITAEQGQMMARGLMAVARADGSVDERELGLIRSLVPEGSPELPDVAPEELAGVIGSGEAGQLFLKSCLLVALADQAYSEPEKSLIARYAEAFRISAEELDVLAQSVKEFLLLPLSRLANVDSVVAVAKKLEV